MSHNVTVQNINIPNLSVIERAVKELRAAGSKISISSAPGKFRGWQNSLTDAERVITVEGSTYQIGVVKDGKAFVKERVELAAAKGTFWQDYKFTNPTNKKIEPKSMYCEKLDDAVVCGGIYK